MKIQRHRGEDEASEVSENGESVWGEGTEVVRLDLSVQSELWNLIEAPSHRTETARCSKPCSALSTLRYAGVSSTERR